MKRALLVALLALAGLTSAAPAEAAACSGTSGVTVVVEFPSGSVVRCAPGNPSSGYAALTAAGFALTFAQGSGAGAICRIDGQPSNVNCGAMPPANNYWSYWHAKPGGSWSYSTVGGGGYDPAPGSVEGWVLGDGRSAPSIKPPGGTTATPKPTATPTAKPTRQPAASPTGGSSAAASSSSTGTPSASATASAGAATPSSAASATPTATASGSSADPSASADAVAAADPVGRSARAEEAGQGGLSWLWGVVLLVVLAGAGGATALARRRRT